jgi:hypothetical protein
LIGPLPSRYNDGRLGAMEHEFAVRNGEDMSAILKAVLIAVALTGVPVGYVFYEAVYSPNDWLYKGHKPGNWKDGGVHGAPGPIAGAGLPVIIVAGFGAFWLFRRYRRKPD